MDDLAQEDPAQTVAAFLTDRRAEVGLRRSEVAKRMGYRNQSKGSSRIADWEAGRSLPDRGRVLALAAALEVDSDAMQRLVTRTVERNALERDRACQALAVDERVVAQHLDLLMLHRDRIITTPAWRDTPVATGRVSVAYFGAERLGLGLLLWGWSHGHLLAPTERGVLHVVSLGGSPLTGRHSLRGFDSETLEFRSDQIASGTSLNFGALGVPMLRQARRWSQGGGGHPTAVDIIRATHRRGACTPPTDEAATDWTVAEVVAGLRGRPNRRAEP